MYGYGGTETLPRSRSDPAMAAKWAENVFNKGYGKFLSDTNKLNIIVGEHLLSSSLSRGGGTSHGELFAIGNHLARLAVKQYQRVMDEQDLDVLVCPTIPYLPPLLPDEAALATGGMSLEEAVSWHSLGMIANTAPFSVTGAPALQIPVEPSKDGLPIGLQIVARVGDDARCLRVGCAYERLAK